jgi:uncharacterized protein YyaL (SSP411 family)
MAHGGLDHIPDPDTLKRLPKDGGSDFNRLVFESSPYLLQHAANPVDWFPWGDEAFQKAKSEDKAIFLSIGYATCHWCHVMERESFEDEEVAALLNEHFVCVKVDKEERPDIDHIYMTACQAMTGHGGWPLSILLTHDRKPFYAGTYIPKRGRYGRPGMMDFIPRVAQFWKAEREDLIRDANQLTQAIQAHSSLSPGEPLGKAELNLAYRQLVQRYDGNHGGFGTAPKFPTPHNYMYLLRYAFHTAMEDPLAKTTHSLLAMRRGGLFDHVGFGFHRYSTDEIWLLPHFEKMLYDQAMLAIAYLETYYLTGRTAFADIAEEIFAYVMRDMTAQEGGFYSAEDADSEGEEGKFYVWKPEEVHQVLGEKDGALFCKVYNIQEGGNFRDEATGHQSEDSIPHLQATFAQNAEALGMSREDLVAQLETLRKKLFEYREHRTHPLKDDKVLTDWNGLMIAAFALGGRILKNAVYLEQARKAADFVLDTLRDDRGRLLKRYRAGEAGLTAHLDDYAFTIWGLLELYQASFETRYLEEAVTLTEQTLARFRDPRSGAFFLTAEDSETLITRNQTIYDGAVPSGNSVMAFNLTRLSRMLGNTTYEERAQQIVMAFSGDLKNYPTSSCMLLCAAIFMVQPSYEIVIVGGREDAQTKAMLELLNERYLPNTVVLFKDLEGSALDKLAPFTQGQKAREGKTTAYVCRDFACKAPVNTLEGLKEALPKS